MSFLPEVDSQTLNFSQVLLVNTIEDTVPPGKVWKLESFMQDEVGPTSGTSLGCNNGFINSFFINGARYYKMQGIGSGGAASMAPANPFPIWLPAGTRISCACTGDFLSIIEFSIVP